MSYRNKTYVIFDGDKDMWAYAYMKGWKSSDRVDFDFYDAHDISPVTQLASEETVRRRLRERMGNTKQAVVLVGESTRYLYTFVRWELEMCQKLDIPMVVVNLNGKRQMDPDRCPPLIRDDYAVHVDFKMRIIRHAVDAFPAEYANRAAGARGARYYAENVYAQLGLL
jgi:hypothetical protein